MTMPSTIFPRLVWNRDAQGGRYHPSGADGNGRSPEKPDEHRDYENEKKGRPHRIGEGPRWHEGAHSGYGKGGHKPVPEVDPATDPPRSSPGE